MRVPSIPFNSIFLIVDLKMYVLNSSIWSKIILDQNKVYFYYVFHSQLKRDYKRWTEEEKELLLNLASKNQNYNGKIYWDLVQKSFPERTATQCKHYYQNIIKQKDEFFSPSEMLALYLIVYKHGVDMTVIKKYFPNRVFSTLQQPLEQVKQCRALYSDVFMKLSKNETVILSQFEHKLLLIVLYLLQYRYQLYLNPTMKQMPPYPPEMKKMIENMDLDKFLLKTTLHEVELYQIERADRLYSVPKLISAIPLLEKWYADLYGKDFSSTQ
ncbi:Myb-like_DNA-binding domain-containing protein [Hexamita inflata]|uniref:Myb-like_DNA-binding domain-containing protein n=1 Tax=Hexamita inflata TaxID=28002 RepID=A0ABP1HZV5_9EUKA